MAYRRSHVRQILDVLNNPEVAPLQRHEQANALNELKILNSRGESWNNASLSHFVTVYSKKLKRRYKNGQHRYGTFVPVKKDLPQPPAPPPPPVTPTVQQDLFSTSLRDQLIASLTGDEKIKLILELSR